MKHSSILAGAIFLFFLTTTVVIAEPFAALVDIPDEMTKESHGEYLNAMTAKKSIIPSLQEVGFPAYPGAKILFTQMNNSSNENGTSVDLPKRIYMGTSDSVQQVTDFYKQHLNGWKYKKIYGAPTFYKKEGEFNPMEDMTTPRIVIAPEFRPRKLMPTSKTTIDIYYSADR